VSDLLESLRAALEGRYAVERLIGLEGCGGGGLVIVGRVLLAWTQDADQVQSEPFDIEPSC
jgi:hypothetical protein